MRKVVLVKKPSEGIPQGFAYRYRFLNRFLVLAQAFDPLNEPTSRESGFSLDQALAFVIQRTVRLIQSE
jgi:hypothetical protein